MVKECKQVSKKRKLEDKGGPGSAIKKRVVANSAQKLGAASPVTGKQTPQSSKKSNLSSASNMPPSAENSKGTPLQRTPQSAKKSKGTPLQRTPQHKKHETPQKQETPRKHGATPKQGKGTPQVSVQTPKLHSTKKNAIKTRQTPEVARDGQQVKQGTPGSKDVKGIGKAEMVDPAVKIMQDILSSGSKVKTPNSRKDIDTPKGEDKLKTPKSDNTNIIMKEMQSHTPVTSSGKKRLKKMT